MARNLDIVKAVNRCMFDKRNEQNYLGCNARMRDESRDQDKAVRNVSVELGFSAVPEDVDSIVADVKDAVSQLFDSVKIESSDLHSLKSGQSEIGLTFECEETRSSEEKLEARNEEERKKKEEERQAELRKQVEAEEEARRNAEKAATMKKVVTSYAEKLAKCKTQEKLDEVFDEIEGKKKEFIVDDFNYLTDIYNQAKSRINIGKLDDSLYLKLKYGRQINNAESTSDIHRIRQFILEHFTNGRMDKETITYLRSLLDDAAKRMHTVGDSVPGKFDDFVNYARTIFEDVETDPEGACICVESDDAPAVKKMLEAWDVKYSVNDDSYVAEFIIPKLQFTTDSKVLDISPRKGESKNDFISRFMSVTKEEYPDQKQRLAVAYSYWKNRKK